MLIVGVPAEGKATTGLVALQSASVTSLEIISFFVYIFVVFGDLCKEYSLNESLLNPGVKF